METLRIGIPSKGRLSDLASELLQSAGMSFRRQNRSLFARVRDMPLDIIFLRTDDIPVLCAEGAIDMGITGSDLVIESQVEVITRMQLGVGQCRLALCVPEETGVQSASELSGRRIATTFPRITEAYLREHQTAAHLVRLSGSVEIMVSLGVAEAIVDLVETGSTLAANKLRILDTIGNYETVLIQDPKCRHVDMADRVYRRIEGIVIARDYSLLEYNIPRVNLVEAERITPGFNSPTINVLENPDYCSVRVMVKRKDVATVLESLEAVGASAILETKITNCRL